MRKTKELILVIVVLAVLVALVSLAQAKDLRDFLMQPKASVYAEYGWGEDTFRLYNMVATKELGQSHETRIKALETQVVELKEQVVELKPKLVDPNEPTLESRLKELEDFIDILQDPNHWVITDINDLTEFKR